MTDPTPPLKSSPGTAAEPGDGARLLDEVEAFHRRFNVFPVEAAFVAVALWDAHAHLLECFDSTPRMAFLSPEPGSGKTRALEIVETLVPNPMPAVNASAAALFRAVSAGESTPTILFDEIDTVFGPKAGDNEELRGWINAGHRRSGVTYRCVGDGSNQSVQAFPSYCAVAVAGLGSLPDTIL
ncbi:DNA primase, partial [Streptomyces sp. SID3343]|nr:DNA primase [Streptomyces sp. SID3343]